MVAIPALAGYAIIRNRIDELTLDATLRAEELLNQFRPKPASAQQAAGAMPHAKSKTAPPVSASSFASADRAMAQPSLDDRTMAGRPSSFGLNIRSHET